MTKLAGDGTSESAPKTSVTHPTSNNARNRRTIFIGKRCHQELMIPRLDSSQMTRSIWRIPGQPPLNRVVTIKSAAATTARQWLAHFWLPSCFRFLQSAEIALRSCSVEPKRISGVWPSPPSCLQSMLIGSAADSQDRHSKHFSSAAALDLALEIWRSFKRCRGSDRAYQSCWSFAC